MKNGNDGIEFNADWARVQHLHVCAAPSNVPLASAMMELLSCVRRVRLLTLFHQRQEIRLENAVRVGVAGSARTKDEDPESRKLAGSSLSPPVTPAPAPAPAAGASVPQIDTPAVSEIDGVFENLSHTR